VVDIGTKKTAAQHAEVTSTLDSRTTESAGAATNMEDMEENLIVSAPRNVVAAHSEADVENVVVDRGVMPCIDKSPIMVEEDWWCNRAGLPPHDRGTITTTIGKVCRG
jgi:hypothetical protein